MNKYMLAHLNTFTRNEVIGYTCVNQWSVFCFCTKPTEERTCFIIYFRGL